MPTPEEMKAKREAALAEAKRRAAAKAAIAEQEARAKEPIEKAPSKYADAVPDLDDDVTKDRRAEEDAAIGKLRILDVYKRLTGNEPKKSGGSNEKMIFCPAAGHDNTNTEAASINTAKNTWVCYGQCESGGGIIDMVAAHSGMPFGSALKGSDYAEAKSKVLVDFCGWSREKEDGAWVLKSPAEKQAEVAEFEKLTGTKSVASQEDEDADSVVPDLRERPEEASETRRLSVVRDESPDEPPTVVVDMPISDLDDDAIFLPEIDNILETVPENTALHEYVSQFAGTETPKEFALFRGIQLLSLCAGPYVRGRIRRLVKPSMSVLFVGGTGAGKSTSRGAMKKVLEDPSFAWSATPPTTGQLFGDQEGVKNITEPGSGEYLIESLGYSDLGASSYPLRDTVAYLEIDEFARFIKKTQTQGSTLGAIFQEFDNDASLEFRISAGSRALGTKQAVNPYLVYSAGVQPKALPKLLGKDAIDNGLMARFDMVTANRVKGIDFFDLKVEDVTRATVLYTKIYSHYLGRRDPSDPRQIIEITLDPACQDRINELWARMQDLKASDDIKSRFDLKLFKFCTLFAINRCSDVIEMVDIDCAEWIMEYLNRSTSLVGGQTTVTETILVDECVVTAVKSLTKSKGFATASQVYNFIKGNKRGWHKERVVKSIEVLMSTGEVVVDPGAARKGPRAERYVYVGDAGERIVR